MPHCSWPEHGGAAKTCDAKGKTLSFASHGSGDDATDDGDAFKNEGDDKEWNGIQGSALSGTEDDTEAISAFRTKVTIGEHWKEEKEDCDGGEDRHCDSDDNIAFLSHKKFNLTRYYTPTKVGKQ